MVDIVLEQRRQMREELSLYAREKGFETFAEAEDFDVEDDLGAPVSPWDNEFEPDAKELAKMDQEKWDNLQQRIKEARDLRKKGVKPSSEVPSDTVPEGGGAPEGGEDAAAT